MMGKNNPHLGEEEGDRFDSDPILRAKCRRLRPRPGFSLPKSDQSDAGIALGEVRAPHSQVQSKENDWLQLALPTVIGDITGLLYQRQTERRERDPSGSHMRSTCRRS